MEAIKIPEIEITLEMEQEANQLMVTSQAISVVHHEDYLFAAEQLKFIRIRKNQVKELFKEPKSAADKAHKAIVAAEKKILDPLLRAEALYGDKVVLWEREQQRKEREEADRIRREAEERMKREAEAFREKEESERKALAAQMREQGFEQEADEILGIEPPPPVLTPIIPQPVATIQRAQGVHLRKTYRANVVNLMSLVIEVAAGRQPLAYLMPNQSRLDDVAGALKEEFRVPGCEVVEYVKPVTRSK